MLNYMEVKFNSLFDNEFDEINEIDFYSINRSDDTLVTSNILLTFDKKKLLENSTLYKRNFGDSNDYMLGPRPCSTRHASSNKFCDYPGLPEVYEEKKNKCNIDFIPNSSIGNRNKYLRNIDIENKILQRDYKDSKCDIKNKKEDICNETDPNCILNCSNNIFKKDNMTINRKSFNPKENNRLYCDSMNKSFSKVKKNFNTYNPTKRINVIEW